MGKFFTLIHAVFSHGKFPRFLFISMLQFFRESYPALLNFLYFLFKFKKYNLLIAIMKVLKKSPNLFVVQLYQYG